MIKVDFKGITYYLGWRYLRSKKKVLKACTCLLVDADRNPLYHATVKKWSEDAPNYEKARHFSIQKLVDDQFPGKDNKEIRAAIWSAYWNRPRPTGKKKNEESN